MKKVFGKAIDNAISLGVVIIVLFLIIPIRTELLDFLLIINIGLSIMILMITMNISETLEFSIFPSLLLVTTLFRLGLNVSSTRAILSRGYAGEVIQNFGNLITGGNIVVGVVIFLIIVLVQFIVITKGAERVAEVAARFTLDAMPGKQMAIDADLSSGLIDEQTARLRRGKIQKEADFYGAMDGATKIVKGDAVMSLIITLINFVGGVIIGMVMGGGDFSTVLQKYSIVTIGDGLVSQLPALMISTATGMIVTRSVSEGSLNKDVVAQFKAQPRAILTTGIILIFLALIPNTPHLALLMGGSVLIGGGYLIERHMKSEAAAAAVAEEQKPAEETAPNESDSVSNKDTIGLLHGHQQCVLSPDGRTDRNGVWIQPHSAGGREPRRQADQSHRHFPPPVRAGYGLRHPVHPPARCVLSGDKSVCDPHSRRGGRPRRDPCGLLPCAGAQQSAG